MNIQLRMDYATFNLSPCFSRGIVSDYLLPGGDLCWSYRGLNENSVQTSPMGLSWMNNSGFEKRPRCLRVSGVGCEKFMFTLPNLFNSCTVDQVHISRVDFAFDVVMKRAAWRDFICKAFSASMNSSRARKKFTLAGEGEAMTIYIGGRRSAKYFRIYNKTLEDPLYQLEGDRELCEDECVIRYEVEFKHYKWVDRNFDPTPLFMWYYSDLEEDHQRLTDFVFDAWNSFGDEVLLPQDFQNSEFSLRVRDKSVILFNSVEPDPSYKIQYTIDQLYDYPHEFNRSLNYVVERFGKYIPYIISDPALLQSCEAACKFRFGFVPEYEILKSRPAGFYDLDGLDDSDFPEEFVFPEQEVLEEFTGGEPLNECSNLW